MSGVAVLRSLGNATAQLSPESATAAATGIKGQKTASPMTGRELRAQLRAQQPRNSELQPPQLERIELEGVRNADAESCAVAIPSKRNNATVGETSYWWSVSLPGGSSFDFCSVPELTRVEVEALYAGATVTIPAQPTDDRRTCKQCANLARDRRCLAADRGEKLGFGHGRNYHPTIDLPLRCIGFQALSADTDQRAGRERWPWLRTDTTAGSNG